MTIKAFIPGSVVVGTLVVAGLLFGGLPAAAQNQEPVVILKPMEDSDLPAGSQITDDRLQETKTKIQELKANLKAQQLRQQQQQQQAPQEGQTETEGGQD